MLVTTCKHCAARFRVTPEQLNLRQGQVRCGQCQEVFNGFESLERFPGDDTGARLLAARAAKAPAHDILEDLGNSDFGTRLRPGTPAPATGPASEPPRAPELTDIPPLPEVPDLVVEAGEAKADFETEAPSLALADLPPAAAPQGEAAPQPDPMLAVAALENSIAAAAPTRVSRAWSFGVALAALVLALQLAYAWRAQLAQQYPDLRPILEAACAKAGCSVPWVNDEAALKLEDSELLEVPGKPGQIALQARIRNLSAAAQEFPHLELTLTDVTGQTAVRRVLRPADFLGRSLYPGEVMAGASEVLVSVRLETARIRPTGYELLLFYP